MLPSVEAMITSFAAAYTDIRRLLARDCWPRFKLSRFYPAFNRLVEEEAQLTIAVTGMATPDSVGTRRRRTSTGTERRRPPTDPSTSEARATGGQTDTTVENPGLESS